ncbi:MAG: NUDIX domain-containing protein [Lentisphaeria bacterium]|nr:NUDIX domain-containing protein [Lentisphaeria bacterium]
MAVRLTIVAAVVRSKGKLLLTSRPADKPPYGLEFPGGKVEPGETFAQALRRELEEELGIPDAVVLDPIYRTSTEKLDIWFMRTVIPPDRTIVCRERQRHFWVDPGDTEETEKLFSGIPLLANDLIFWKFLCG